MAMTPEDLLNKTFSETKFRSGYDKGEVDDFLDQVVAEWRRRDSEYEAMRVRVQRLERGEL